MSNSGTYINPGSKNIVGRDRYSIERKAKFFPIFLAEVVDIDLETKIITFRPVDVVIPVASGEADISTSVAVPLLPNICQVPLRGEIVLINFFGRASYYISLNYNNSTISNQEIRGYGSDPNSSPAFASNKTFDVSGKDIQNSNITEGDILIEGRYGHAIKFGSTVKYQNAPQTNYSKSDLSQNADPIMIIRNGIRSFDEDIRKDDSSIYLCSTQKIELDTNQNGLECIIADWSTINVNNQVVEAAAVEEDVADVHSEQNTIPPPTVTPREELPAVGTPLANLPVESNTAALAVLIGNAESNNNYSKIVGGKIDDSILDMTITQIDQTTKYGRAQHPPSGASIGRFQIQSATALDICRANKINATTFKFDAAGQDKLYQLLLNRRGYKLYMNGSITEEQFANNLSKEWASLPKDASGVSYYAGVSTNAALVRWDDLLRAIRGLKKKVQATPATSPAVGAPPAPNSPPPPPPATQAGYTSNTDSNPLTLPKLPRKYQRYKGGVPVGNPIDIYVIDNVPVSREIADIFSKMKKDAWEQDKVILQLNSAFRSMEDMIVNGETKQGQQSLYDNYKRTGSPVAARPGFSNHQNGIAMDINTKGTAGRKAYKWLIRNGLRYGVVRAVASERWHWEYHPDANTAFWKVPKSHETWDGLTDGIV